MANKINWELSPRDAEAGCPPRPGFHAAWYKKDKEGQVWQFCQENGWAWMAGRTDFPLGYELRPNPKHVHKLTIGPWDGEGLPPVGITVEAHIDHSWVSAEVLAHGVDGEDEVAVLQVGSRIKTKTFTGVRPIRTPEQIAAEEREKAVKELFFTINWQSSEAEWDAISNDRKCDYAKAIDAGYRKQVAP